MQRVIHGRRRALHDVLVVDIGNHPDDTPWERFGSEVRIDPPELVIESVTVREDALGHALADDDDTFLAAAIIGGEITAGNQGHAEHVEEIRRDDAQAGAWIFFTIRRCVTVSAESDAGNAAEPAGVAPWREVAEGYTVHPGQLADLAGRLLVE